jgi:hypothetical protein
MGKLLISIKSCRRDWMRGDHDVIRSTWGKDVPEGVDLRFFMGTESYRLCTDGDEEWLDVKDDYDSLPQKVKAIFKWALEKQYDYIFLADTDTFVIPKRLIALPFQDYDLSGRFGKIKPIGETFRYIDGRDIVYDPCWPWPSGGCGYFVSAKGADYILRTGFTGWAEDIQSGQALGPLEKLGLVKIGDLEDLECKASWHFPRWKYNQEVYHPRYGWQEKMYKEHNENSDSH